MVAVPNAMCFAEADEYKKIFDYVYYLGAEHNEQLKKIINILEEMASLGYRVAIRPHPRYSNLNEVKKMVKNIKVEDLNQVSIQESILQTNNVISIYSTVLNQAYHNGIGIVIDDITDKEKYEKLKKMNYVMLAVKHKLLSQSLELQNERIINEN